METSPNPNLPKNNTVLQKSCPKKSMPNKWDKCLDDYENYLKEYIKQYKKSIKGNLNSLSKYPYMKAKTEALYEQLNTAKNKDLLTKKQLKRIPKIQMRLFHALEI